MLMQLHNTFLWYSNVSGALYRMKLYKSTFSIYSSYNCFFFIYLFIYPYVYKYMILVSCR